MQEIFAALHCKKEYTTPSKIREEFQTRFPQLLSIWHMHMLKLDPANCALNTWTQLKDSTYPRKIPHATRLLEIHTRKYMTIRTNRIATVYQRHHIWECRHNTPISTIVTRNWLSEIKIRGRIMRRFMLLQRVHKHFISPVLFTPIFSLRLRTRTSALSIWTIGRAQRAIILTTYTTQLLKKVQIND